MMVERHYDDEALMAFLETAGRNSDAHLPSCPECRDKLEAFRLIEDALRDGATWDTRAVREQPVPDTVASLRAFADRMTAEDALADVYLEDLLNGPRELWVHKLREHPEYWTAGVVRRLVAMAPETLGTMPPDAAEMARLATDIADHLDPADHPSDTVPRLRGAAWRERAYAAVYTGQYGEAETAVDRAENEFAQCIVDEYDLARVGIVKALVGRPFERFAAGLEIVRASGATFARFGDAGRVANAHLTRGHMLLSADDYRGALAVFTAVYDADGKVLSDETLTVLYSNLAFCHKQLGNYDTAIRFCQLSASLLELLGKPSDAARLRWNVASILLDLGRFDEACTRLSAVRAELRSLEMAGAAAAAGLDLAEAFAAQSRHGEMELLCRELVEEFKQQGLSGTTRATTAIAFLDEAVRNRKASPELVRHVRSYVRSLESQPQLLFAPPPDWA